MFTFTKLIKPGISPSLQNDENFDVFFNRWNRIVKIMMAKRLCQGKQKEKFSFLMTISRVSLPGGILMPFQVTEKLLRGVPRLRTIP